MEAPRHSRSCTANELDINTAQTPGMNRAARSRTRARSGEALGRDSRHPSRAKTGAHHHGPVESVIYVVSGRARMRWGDKLEFVAEAGPGDFIYVPPYVRTGNQRERRSTLSCVLVRSGRNRGGEPRYSGGREARGGALVDNIHPGRKGASESPLISPSSGQPASIRRTCAAVRTRAMRGKTRCMNCL